MSVGYRTKGVYASPLKWSPGEQKPQGCFRHQRRSQSFPWPQTACGPEGPGGRWSPEQTHKSLLGQGQRKASLGLRKFKETRIESLAREALQTATHRGLVDWQQGSCGTRMLQGCLQGQTARGAQAPAWDMSWEKGGKMWNCQTEISTMQSNRNTYSNEESWEKKQQLSLHLLDTQMCTLVKINP